MGRKRNPSNYLIALLLVVYAGLAVWYSLSIPLGEAPDEVDHYRVVRYLVQYRHLPTTEEEHEAVQPPLYYLTAAALTFWIPDHAPFVTLANADFDLTDPLAPRNLLLHPATEAWPFRGWALAWRLSRLLTVAFGGLAVWAIFKLGRELFPDRPEIGLGMAALTAFTPQFLFMSGVVSNDVPATALSALTLAQTAALLRRDRFETPHLVGLGLCLGLALLSKSNALALVPVVGLALLIVWGRRRPRELGPLLKAGLLVGAPVMLLAGWYYVRNWLVFGDPLGFSFVMQTNPVRQDALSIEVLTWLFRGLFRSFWLGWIGIELDGWIYGVLAALALLACLGFVAWMALRWRALQGGRAVPGERAPAYLRWMVALLALHAAATLLSLIRWTAMVRGTDQGRLIYPLLPAVMLVLLVGLLIHLPPKGARTGAGLLAAAWLVMALITPGRYLAPVYGPPPTVDALPAQTTPLDLRVDDAVRLVGYRIDTLRVSPGAKLPLHLYWQADAAPQTDLWVLIELVDESGAFVMYKDGSLSAGRDTTDRWTPGVLIASEHRLAVPDHAQPGVYRLALRFHPSAERAWLPIRDAQGQPVGEQFILDPPVEILSR